MPDFPRAVTPAVFGAHKHNYREITRMGVDADDKWNTPQWVNITGDGDFHVSDVPASDLEAAGVTVATAPTSPPV